MIRTKEKSLSVLIKEADEVFSEYVRVRDAESFTGIVTCFVTGEKAHWKKCDAAHFRPRQYLPTRWTETNVHATTLHSNRLDLGHDEMYEAAIESKYGSLMVYGLLQLSLGLMKPTRSDIQDIIDKYSVKVKELRKQKHI